MVGLAKRQVLGMGCQAFIGLAETIVPIARPAVVARIAHHAGPYGVEFDVARTQQEIPLFLDDAGLEAALPQGSGTPVGPVDVLHVAAAYRLHQAAGSIGRFRRDQKMNVVGHQHIGMDGAAVIGSRFLQPMEVAVIVLLGEETRLPIDAALHEVLGQVGNSDSGAAGHDY